MTSEKRGGLPSVVLPGLCWCFCGGEYADRATFERDIRQYQIDITGEDVWAPEAVVLPCPRIRLVYLYWHDEDQLDGEVELTSDESAAFTALELMFKLHNAVVDSLREDNHCFFEGLSLHSSQAADEEPPVYVLRQGS